jgi:hypothetical protein
VLPITAHPFVLESSLFLSQSSVAAVTNHHRHRKIRVATLELEKIAKSKPKRAKNSRGNDGVVRDSGVLVVL